MIIDLHCHLDILKDIDGAIKRAEQAGVTKIVASGIDEASNRKVIELSETYAMVEASLGVYPDVHLDTGRKANVEKEIGFIEKNKDKIVAVGEIGLDFKNVESKDNQYKTFHSMLELACRLKKPVILHTRKAEAEVIDVIESYPGIKKVMHCFSGKKKQAARAYELGCYFTIPTSIVRSEQFQDLAKDIPLSRLFCETDSPFLSPFKEKPNEPAFVVESLNMIAKIKGITAEEAKKAMFMNYQRVFG